MTNDPLLYGILDLGYVAEADAASVTACLLDGGAGLLQLRAKHQPLAAIRRVAEILLPVCRAAGVPFILNDHPALAAEIGTEGVHLGQDDGTLAAARRVIGPDRIIGRSTHSLEQARVALAEGFDYIGFGPLFPTPTKAGRPAIGLQDIAAMEREVGCHIPAFCIGGIKRSNLTTVLAAGARRVVIVSDLLLAPDVRAATREARAMIQPAADNAMLENLIPTRQGKRVHQAFIPGAGLGTRLRPLTSHLPKPLVPLYHRAFAEWAMSSCVRAGIRRFAINTHHLADAWSDFGNPATTGQPRVTGANGLPAVVRTWEGNEVTLFHEPVLLETGGGLKNIAAWIGEEPLLVHNGDIFATLPVDQLIAAHAASGFPVTLALRSAGHAKHIALDASHTRVTDIRRLLGRADGTHVFSGIYCVNPGFLRLLPAGEKVSVIPAFLTLAQQNQLGAVVLDEGVWLDLGDRDSYLLAHRELSLGPRIHPLARIEDGAIVENSVVGADAVVASGAIVRDSILWAGSRIAGDAVLDACIVCSGRTVSGSYQHADL